MNRKERKERERILADVARANPTVGLVCSALRTIEEASDEEIDPAERETLLGKGRYILAALLCSPLGTPRTP